MMHSDNKDELANIVDRLVSMVEHGIVTVTNITDELNNKLAFKLGIKNGIKTGSFNLENFKLVPSDYNFDQWITYYKGYMSTKGHDLDGAEMHTLLILLSIDVGNIEAEEYNQREAHKSSFNIFSKSQSITDRLNSLIPCVYADAYNKSRKLHFGFKVKK